MVGAGVRAVGVQRRDAATAGRRRDGARARGVWGGPHARRGTTPARRPVPVPRGRPLRGAAMDEGLKALVFEGATARTGAARRRGSI